MLAYQVNNQIRSKYARNFITNQINVKRYWLVIDSREKFTIDEETIKWLAEISDGDARIALNSLQMSIQSKPEGNSVITLSDIKESIKVRTKILASYFSNSLLQDYHIVEISLDVWSKWWRAL